MGGDQEDGGSGAGAELFFEVVGFGTLGSDGSCYLMADINLTQDEADKLIAMENALSMKKIGSFRLQAIGLRFR